MLKHWTWRQAAGKIPLQFKKAVKAIGGNKDTSEENDGDIEMRPGEEAEEDDDDAQRDGALHGDDSNDGSTGQARPSQRPGDVAKSEHPSEVGSRSMALSGTNILSL